MTQQAMATAGATADEVAADRTAGARLTERYLGSVQTWECDTMGHMNVQFYCAKAWEAEQGLWAELRERRALRPPPRALRPPPPGAPAGVNPSTSAPACPRACARHAG